MIERWARYMVQNGVKPEHEVYDTGMLNACKTLYDKKVITEPLHVQFVMVGKTGFSPNPRVLQYCLDQMPSDWTWSVCGIGRHQIPLAALGTVMGGHVRVGLEDNIYLRKGVLAESNAQLVQKVANIANELERPIAKPKDTRKILGLK
jgi:3-keto-5-aminohexanoate cleavage enzyme